MATNDQGFDPSRAVRVDNQGFDPSRAIPVPAPQERGYTSAALSGIGESLWGTWAKGLSLAAATPAIAGDYLRGLATGKQETVAQDWVFKNLTDVAGQKAEQYALTPTESQSTGKVIAHGVGGMLPTLAAALLTKGAIGGPALSTQSAAMLGRAAGVPLVQSAVEGAALMAPAAAAAFGAGAAKKVEQGTDVSTALATGGVDATAALVSGALPVSAAGGLATRLATGAAMNVATGEAQRVAQNAVVSDRPDLQRGATAQDMTVNAIMGAAFAGILGPRPEKAAVSAAKAETQALLDDKPAAPAAPLRIGYEGTRGQGTMVAFPDGSVAATPEQALIKQYWPQEGTPPAVEPAPTTAAPRADGKPTATGVDAERVIPPAEGIPGKNAMTLALEQAQKAAAFTQAETAALQAKGIELDRIQNIARADELLAAAERGVVPANTVDLPRPPSDFTTAVAELMTEANSPRLKQDVAKAVMGRKTVDEQVQALQALRDGVKNQQSNRYEFLSRLIDQFSTKKGPTDEASLDTQAPEAIAPVAQGEAQPRPAVDGTPAEPVAPAVSRQEVDASTAGRALEVPKPVDHVQEAIDALTSAYGDETKAMQAAKRIMDEANAAAPDGKADPQVMLQMARDDAARTAELRAESDARAAEAALRTRNIRLDPEFESTMEQVNAARATLSGLADEYAARLQAKEVLDETEHARYESAAEIQRALNREMRPGAAPSTIRYLQDMAKFAEDFTTPEKFAKAKTDWLEARPAGADRPSKAITALMDQPRPVNDYLDLLEANGSEDWVRELAGKLRGFELPTTVDNSRPFEGPQAANTAAAYDAIADTVIIGPYGRSEATVLHEVVHAATKSVIDMVRTKLPGNQVEAQRSLALRELEDIRTAALKRANPSDQYGLTNAYEFLAELNTNPGFQEFLRDRNLWTRVVDTVRKLLGLPVKARGALERALELQKDLFNTQAYEAAQAAKKAKAEFDAAPAKAAEVTDSTLQKLLKDTDEESKLYNFGRATTHRAMKALLAWETKQYITDRVASVPEFRAAGLADAARAMYQTDLSRRDANTFTQRAAVDFASKLDAALNGIKDGPARKRANDMAGRVAVGSSIGGFDPWMNFKDNLVDHPKLDPKMAAHVNQTHRDFMALKREHPALAQAVIDGAKANRHDYVASVSTVVDNLLRHAAQVELPSEADLNAMDPVRAATVRASALSAGGATPEAAFAAPLVGRLDFMARDIQEAKNTDPQRFYDGAGAELHRRLKEVFDQAKTLPADSTLRAQLLEVGRVYGQQIENAYYHAGRDGGYFVNVGFKDMDDATWAKMDGALEGSGRTLGDYTDQDTVFMKVDTLEQAEALRRKLVDAAGPKLVPERVRHGLWATEGRLDSNAGISTAMRSVLETVQDSVKEAGLDAEQAATMRDVISRKFLSMMPETSVKTAKLHRAGVPGYDTDFLGTFTKHAMGSTRDSANMYAMRSYAQAIKGMNDGVAKLAANPTGDFQVRGQMVRDELLKRYNNSMKVVDSGAVNVINSLGHSFYLALSPAFFIRSMAQPYHRGLPYLGSRYGFVSSAKAIGSATGVAMKVVANSIRNGWKADGAAGVLDANLMYEGLDLTPSERAFMHEMHDRGVFDLGQARQLQRMAMEGDRRMQTVTRVASLTAQYSDMVNRIATGLAAFRLAEKGRKGLAGANTTMDHMNYADSAIKYIMDDFSPDNTARAIGKHGVFGKVTPLTTAFMNYNLQTMQQIARTVLDGMLSHDTTPEGLQIAKEARRELAGLMGTTAMISGAMGLPFANAFAGVYNSLFNDEDDPHDIRVDARNWLRDTLGAQVGEAVAHGPLQALTGIESSTFGMQNLLPGSEFLASRRLFKDRLDELPKSLMGPALNAGLDLATGAMKIADGQYVKGVGQMLPSGFKGYWKAGEIAANGYTDSKGNPIGLQPSSWDIAVQATGLRPADRAETAEAQSAFSATQQRLNYRKSILTDRLYKAVRLGTQDDVSSVMQEISDFNAKNPMQPLTNLSGSLKARMMQEVMGSQVGGVVVGSKRLMSVAQDETRFNPSIGMEP